MGTELVSRLEQGDVRGAARWLVLEHGAEVLGLCRAMVRDPATAEDLAQDAFGRAFTGLASYRGEASPRTWLLAIARNRCIDHLRRRKARPWGIDDEVDAEEAPDEQPLPSSWLTNRTLVERGLRVLDESQRALVVLRFQHELGYDELAEAFGLRPGTVRMRVSRALAVMREALEEPPREGARRARVRAEPDPLRREISQGRARSTRSRMAAAPASARATAPPPRAAPPAPARPPAIPPPGSSGAIPGGRGGAAPPPAAAPRPSASAGTSLGALLRSMQEPLGRGLAARLEALVEAIPR
ncbi:MAG: sigma-70 family RNA polymerase sigma factor [Myxococcales bacterium]|nr:sigma-70 family RNA polymerase sigma factor [Myxococcales bacterium]